MNVFCFDFDGVICDSAPETAVTAWRACRALWPEDGGTLHDELMQRFRRLRPVMHTGYEAVPLLRLIETGTDDLHLLADFPALRDELMQREGLVREQLAGLFNSTRDTLIVENQDAWVRMNTFYPGIREAAAAALARHPTCVITTKAERFADLLLRHHGLAVPPERLYGLERNRPKPDILADLLARPEHTGATFHFIEDRLETLQAVTARPDLAAVRLYLAGWGYNTPAQRQEAAGDPRIEVVDVPAFAKVIAGVG